MGGFVNHSKGFTLIELVACVLILGILSAVALPQYHKAIEKAHSVEGKIFLSNVEKAQSAYYMANYSFSEDLDSLDMDVTNGLRMVTKTNPVLRFSTALNASPTTYQAAYLKDYLVDYRVSDQGYDMSLINEDKEYTLNMHTAWDSNGNRMVVRECTGNVQWCKLVTDSTPCSGDIHTNWCYRE